MSRGDCDMTWLKIISKIAGLLLVRQQIHDLAALLHIYALSGEAQSVYSGFK